MKATSKHLALFLILGLGFSACAQDQPSKDLAKEKATYSVVKSDSEWKTELRDQEYYILREKGTERAFTGDLLNTKAEGVYVCRGCQNPLFNSSTKFESGTGWPSFFDEIQGHVDEDTDVSFGMARTEILCHECGGHLGHVFSDGPQPTGLRYCVNSASLDFEEGE